MDERLARKVVELIDDLIDVRIDLITAQGDETYERRRDDLLDKVGSIKRQIVRELRSERKPSDK